MIHSQLCYRQLYTDKEKFIILVTGGRGCEDPDTPIMMYDRSIRRIKDIRIGDRVMGDDGTSREVMNTLSGRSTMYRVHQSNGDDYIVNDTHILTLFERGRIVDVPIKEYLAKRRDILYKGVRVNFIDFSTSLTDIQVTEIGEGNWCGMILDGNHRYCHSDGTITHNSGKSFNVGAFIERLTFELGKLDNGDKVSHQMLYTRYTMTSAEMSVIPEFMEKIELDGTEKYFHKAKSDVVNVMTGSRIMFRGIKTSSGNQTAKLKSIKGITTFICDEAEEWTSEDEFEKIMFSIRQQGLQNRIIIIMNPSDSNHFVYRKYIKDTHKIVEYDGVPVQISTHPNVLHIHTSFLDNKDHLAEQFLTEAAAMKERDPERYGHIFMGRWADVAEGAIFKKWGIVKEFPKHAKKVALAMDFGYSADPTAIVKCGVVDNALYIDELCYQTGMLSRDIIKTIKANNEDGSLFVYSESADPRLIDEIGLGGIIIYPVQKGPGSIMAGIDKMLTMDIYITERSLNAQDEFRNYVWAKNKEGQYINMPEGGKDHIVDSCRYFCLAVLLGKVMKPKETTKERLGIF